MISKQQQLILNHKQHNRHDKFLRKDIENVLIAFADEASAHQYKGDLSWTSGIMEKLAELGCETYDLHISTSAIDGYEKGWLYDMVWYEVEDDSENKLVRIPLVVESEWNISLRSIKYDFEKLLVANAGLRLMICQARTNKKELTLDYFEKAIKAYKQGQAGERFMIALLDVDNEAFSFHYFQRDNTGI